MSQNLQFIQSLPDLLYYYTADKNHLSISDNEALRLLGKILYKHTTCGVFLESVEVLENGRISKIALGSIVEGSEAQTETHIFIFPFSLEDWNQALESVENEAEDLWNEININHDEMDIWYE